MCRNIKPLHNFEPPATDAEIRAASLQFVRKISGLVKPSSANEAAFEKAIADISGTITELLNALVTSAQPRDREAEVLKAKSLSEKRFATGN